MNDFYENFEEQIDIPDKDFQFAEIMNAFVEKEVQKRVQAKFDNFNHVTQTYDKMTKEIEDLKRERRNWERDLELAKDEYYKKGNADGMRVAFGGRAVKDKGFVIRYRYINNDCPDCNRTGRVMATVQMNGESTTTEVRCPTCEGIGRKSRREEIVAAAYIIQITSKIWNEGRTKEVDLYVKPEGFESFETSPDRFFKTETEAAEAIKNQQEKGKSL